MRKTKGRKGEQQGNETKKRGAKQDILIVLPPSTKSLSSNKAKSCRRVRRSRRLTLDAHFERATDGYCARRERILITAIINNKAEKTEKLHFSTGT